LLEQKLHKAVESARKRLEAKQNEAPRRKRTGYLKDHNKFFKISFDPQKSLSNTTISLSYDNFS